MVSGIDTAQRITVANTQPINTGSGNITATANSTITIYPLINTGARTFYLPATPSLGQIIIVQDAGSTFATYNLTVDGNGNQINVPGSGLGSSVIISDNGSSVWFNWIGTQWDVTDSGGGGGGSGVTSVSGTANRITSTGGTTPVIDISASYVGQASLTTLGTITTGVWNAGAVTSSGAVQGTTLVSTVATGTAPLTVSSTTQVANLNAATAGTATTATTATNATNGATVQTSTNASFFPLFATSSTNGNQPFNLGTGLTFNPSTNNLSTTTFTGALSGNATTATSATSATTATNATNTAITNDTATNATMYPTWVTANTGNLPQKVTDSKLTFNPSTGVLSSTSFTGAGTGLTGTAASLSIGGNSATATALQNARTIGGTSFNGTANIVPATITVADSTDTTCFPALFEDATGDLAPKTDAGLTYNASTGTLNATVVTSGGSAVVTGSPIKTITKQIFTANGTYTPTTGMTYCIVEAIGGGGGGGAADGSTLSALGAGGGQSGGFARSVLTAATIGASKAVVIGGGGAGGTTPSNTGSTGVDTTLGTTIVVAKGGVGGTGTSSALGAGQGGFNSTTGTGDEAPAGMAGFNGRAIASSVDAAVPGNGGSSRLGSGSVGTVSGSGAVAGNNAGANTGGGGSGGSAYNTASDAAGGNGGSGKMIIWEYLSV